MRTRPDLSRLVMLDLSPSEAVILVGLLEGVLKLRGNALGPEAIGVIDGICARVRLQLKQLHWPVYNPAPFPV